MPRAAIQEGTPKVVMGVLQEKDGSTNASGPRWPRVAASRHLVPGQFSSFQNAHSP